MSDQKPTPPNYEIVSTWRVSCDGGGGALGHPLVYYTIPRDVGYVVCSYCDKLFVHESRTDLLAEFGIAA